MNGDFTAMDLIKARLESARRDLLDLSARNRLVSTPRRAASVLEIVDERSSELFRLLVREGKSMTFLPRPEGQGPDDATTEDEALLQPEAVDDEDEGDLSSHHTDLHLQTAVGSEMLQRRLLKLYYDARTFQEEQGVNLLYLALGFLKWFEDDRSDKARFAREPDGRACAEGPVSASRARPSPSASGSRGR